MRYIAVLLALAAYVAGSSVQATAKTHPDVIASGLGGATSEYGNLYTVAHKLRARIRVVGKCHSACALFLATHKPEFACAEPGAELGFHAATKMGRGGVNTRIRDEESTARLLRRFPLFVQEWIEKRGGLTEKMLILKGEELHRLIKPCAGVVAPRTDAEFTSAFERFVKLFNERRDVRIEGRCDGFCPLALGTTLPSQLCAASGAELVFEQFTSEEITKKVWGTYPQRIRDWLAKRGGFGEKELVVRAPEIYELVKPCHPVALATGLAHNERTLPRHFEAVKKLGVEVRITERCGQHCLTALSIIPRTRICAAHDAEIVFQEVKQVGDDGRLTGERDEARTRKLEASLPPDIRRFVSERGGLRKEPVVLSGSELHRYVAPCEPRAVAKGS